MWMTPRQMALDYRPIPATSCTQEHRSSSRENNDRPTTYGGLTNSGHQKLCLAQDPHHKLAQQIVKQLSVSTVREMDNNPP